jgi:hypothetical protein
MMLHKIYFLLVFLNTYLTNKFYKTSCKLLEYFALNSISVVLNSCSRGTEGLSKASRKPVYTLHEPLEKLFIAHIPL